MKQQVLYTGGEIITLDAPARAVLTEGERILAVGNEAALRRMAGPDVREFPLKGQVMMPAFLDSHGHITAFAATLSLAPLGGAGSFAEIVSLLSKSAREHPQREWVIGFGYDHNVLKEGVHPADLPCFRPHGGGEFRGAAQNGDYQGHARSGWRKNRARRGRRPKRLSGGNGLHPLLAGGSRRAAGENRR